MCPWPARARRPRPVTSLLPQWATESLAFTTGVMLRVEPVQARSALRGASFQSVVPSSWRMAKEVKGDLVEMRAVTGDGEVIFW